MIRLFAPLMALTSCALAGAAIAAPQVYTIDPGHTYPSFTAGHQGVSHWQGKFNKASGKVWLDREHSTGKLEITIDTSSINFGFPLLDQIMQKPDYFDVAQYPTATYKSDSITFANGQPSSVNGQLTLRGVTKPVKLIFTNFKCKQNPMFHREVCGGDATAELDRAQFGLTKSIEAGDSLIRLTIQVEAFQGDKLPPMPPMPGMSPPGSAPSGGPPPGPPPASP
jgi:polyisoprenoid-binding protein YceI